MDDNRFINYKGDVIVSKLKGYIPPADQVPGLASGSIKSVLVPITRLIGRGKIRNFRSVIDEDEGDTWYKYEIDTSITVECGIRSILRRSPFQIGDTLAVKETWKPTKDHTGLSNNTYIRYKSNDHRALVEHSMGGAYMDKWRSPVTMPLWACRIFRPVTGVKAIQKDGVWHWQIELGVNHGS